jgi:hypothetical protein
MKAKLLLQQFKKMAILLGCISILFLISCEKEKKDPALEATSITAQSAAEYNVSAKITDRGDYPITDYGFAYYIGQSDEGQSYYYKSVSLGSTIVADTFSTLLKLDNLYYSSGYRCFVKAYVTNEKGTLYSKPISAELAILSLTGVTPTRTKPGDTITLIGNYFGLVPSENHVYLNSSLAQVISGTAKTLKVIVPFDIDTYYDNYISIDLIYNERNYSLDNVLKLIPNAQYFSPSTGTWSTSINVSGSGLYNSSFYIDDTYVGLNTSSSSYYYFYVPYNFLKKQFKIYISYDGIKTEVPGGYFTMDNLSITPLSTTQYYRGSTIYVYGNAFNPSTIYTKLMLGNTVINASSCNNSTAYFSVPSNMTLGTYVAKITNSVDTVTLSSPIKIVGK